MNGSPEDDVLGSFREVGGGGDDEWCYWVVRSRNLAVMQLENYIDRNTQTQEPFWDRNCNVCEYITLSNDVKNRTENRWAGVWTSLELRTSHRKDRKVLSGTWAKETLATSVPGLG